MNRLPRRLNNVSALAGLLVLCVFVPAAFATPPADATSTTLAAPTVTYPNNSLITITVTDTTNPGTIPTGSVNWSIGAQAQSPVTLNGSGQANVEIVSLSGTYSISATYVPTGSFQASSGGTSATISKAVLTIQATAASITYGQGLPTFATTITGLLNGDTYPPAGLTGTQGATTSNATTTGTVPSVNVGT
jgi:hypothetical protein